MSSSLPGDREIAHGLAAALRPALFADAPAVTRVAARDVAQVLGFAGLDAALETLDRFAGPSRPRDVSLLAARLDRLADAAEREGSCAPLRDADGELADWAARIADTDWGVPAGTSGAEGAISEATHIALEVLGDLPLDAPATLDRVRLTGAVAASLRAAVDWAGFDLARRVQVVVHDSALTLTAACGHEAGIGPAAAVLAAVEGSLAHDMDGRWTMRVPLHAERASFLLLRQGRLGFALPWHSVARLRMLPLGAERTLAEPVLAPFTTGPAPEGERPAALVALGLARAWVVADRIVWRISAQPAESDVSGPFGTPSLAVMLDNQERYWVADAAWLLRGVPVPEVAPPAARERIAVAAPPEAAVTEPVIETAPVPSALEPEPEAGATGDSLADAVARAIDSLRFERPAEPVAPEVPAESFAAAPEAPYDEPAAREPEQPRARAPRYHVHTTVVSPSDYAPRAERSAHSSPAPEAHAAAAPAVAEPVAEPIAEPVVEPVAEPIPVSVEAPEPARAAVPAPSAPVERPSEIAARHPARRALVADDSMVARIFLGRMLERRGYIVETVGSGAAMWEELRRGPWSLVCADFAMPDSHGGPHVERLLDFRANCREPFTLVLLTRDDEEDLLSRDAGATLLLRKPFETFALDQLIGPHTPDPAGDRE